MEAGKHHERNGRRFESERVGKNREVSISLFNGIFVEEH